MIAMFRKKHVLAHEFEMNLTPIIDCFVTLICFLLLSATYVNLVTMEAKVPVAVAQAKTTSDQKPKFKLQLTAKASGFEIALTHSSGNVNKSTIAHDATLAGLHHELLKIKRTYPTEYSVHFNSQIEMPYEQLVRIMEVSRNFDTKDEAITVDDPKTGQKMKIDLLFPDFIVADLNK